MKVLVCVRRLDKGGAEMLECRLSQYLNKIGVHADLAGQYDQDQFDGAACAEKWQGLGVPQIVWLKSDRAFGLLFAVVRLIKWIVKNKYDVVISHHSGLDIIAGIACLFTGKKHVAAFHDYFYRDKIGKIRMLIWQLILCKTTAVYTISDYVRRNIFEVIQVKKEKSRTIYNSISIQELEGFVPPSIRQELLLASDAKLILSSGRMNANKGFDTSISILNKILQEENTYFLILGGTSNQEEEDYLQSLMVLIKTEQLEKKVFLMGYRKDAFALMQQGNFYIHLARHEGFGLVLTEAIAAGLPILASDVGGIPEVLKHTPYKTFSLSDAVGIREEARRFIQLTVEQRNELTDQAKKVLPFFTDQRRAEEVKKMLDETVN